MIVLFPEPLAPTIAVNFPAGIDKDIFFNTVTTCQFTLNVVEPSGREG